MSSSLSRGESGSSSNGSCSKLSLVTIVWRLDDVIAWLVLNGLVAFGFVGLFAAAGFASKYSRIAACTVFWPNWLHSWVAWFVQILWMTQKCFVIPLLERQRSVASAGFDLNTGSLFHGPRLLEFVSEVGLRFLSSSDLVASGFFLLLFFQGGLWMS